MIKLRSRSRGVCTPKRCHLPAFVGDEGSEKLFALRYA